MSKVNIAGVKIDDVNLAEASETVLNWLKKGGKHYIVTPNPEFIVAAYDDISFRNILNDADLSIPDGIGLKLSGKLKSRVTGVDLMGMLISKSEENAFTVGFLGGKEGVAKKASECLKKRHPNLKVTFADSGGIVDYDGTSIQNTKYSIPDTDILFVAFGYIKQEKWIKKNQDKYPVKVMMGVGGSLDYIAGVVPRAPKIVRVMGFEWLFRLVVEPWRIRRQLKLLRFLYLLLVS